MLQELVLKQSWIHFQETYDNVMALKYTFNEPEFQETSLEAQDFIRKLLVISPRQRMSAAEALTHPWLAAEPKQIYVATTTYITRTNSRKTSYDRSRLKMFISAKSRWTKCANVMLAVNTLKELS